MQPGSRELRRFGDAGHPGLMMSESRGFFVEVDELVIARARRGDHQALEQLYSVFAGPVYTLGCRLTGAADTGEEILQETFLELLRSISAYRGDGHIGAWLRRIAVSKFLMIRRRSRSRPGERNGEPVEALALQRSHPPDRSWRAGLDLERALARLPETTRTVVWLHDVEGLTHTEIARLFGMSESFSKSQLARGRDRLRQWFEAERSTPCGSDDIRAAGATTR